MGSSSEHCGIPPAYSDIIDSYLEFIECAPARVDRDSPAGDCQTSSNSNSSNSTYRTSSSRAATASSDLRLALRGLCQVGLHIANLRHDRAKAETQLRRLEDRVDKYAKNILLQKLTAGGDNVEGTDLDMSKIASAVMTGRLSDAQGARDLPNYEQFRADAELYHLQAAAGEAVQLRANLGEMTTRLHVEERVLLHSVLDEWRGAIVQYKQHCQRADMPEPEHCEVAGTSEATPSSPVSKSEPGSVQGEVEQLLVRFERRQLQQLLENVSEKLNIRGPLAGGCHSVQTFI